MVDCNPKSSFWGLKITVKIFAKLGVRKIKQKLDSLLRYISSATLSGSVTIQAQAEH